MNELGGLEARFGTVARGRKVSVTFEPQDFILFLDYKVAFDPGTNAFDVVLRRGGCFEGAYRCIERYIEARAEQLDGIESVPADHLDLRCVMMYWGVEKIYEEFRSDLQAAVGERIAWLEQVRPGEGVAGEVIVESRARSLSGLLAYLKRADAEVRRGVLSPETVELWKNIGIDVISEAG